MHIYGMWYSLHDAMVVNRCCEADLAKAACGRGTNRDEAKKKLCDSEEHTELFLLLYINVPKG